MAAPERFGKIYLRAEDFSPWYPEVVAIPFSRITRLVIASRFEPVG